MYKIERYLLDTFGIKIRLIPIGKKEKVKLPVYMRNYELKKCVINKVKMITLKTGNYKEFTIERLKKQADLIEEKLLRPIVFIFENLEAYKRKRLVEKRVAFIIPGKQIYIPFLLMEFKEVKNQPNKEKEGFSPAAQCLLLYYLSGNEVERLNFKTLAERLNYGNMTITRAAQTLNKFNFCLIEGGKNKTLVFEKERKQIWNEALPYLTSPIEKEIYLEEIKNNDCFYIAGMTALANYTNIASDKLYVHAIYKNKFRKLFKNKLEYYKNATEGNRLIQLWKYDPGILTNSKYVDPLSLYLSLQDEKNERVEKELKTMVAELW